jgi:acyl-CoA thioesterase
VSPATRFDRDTGVRALGEGRFAGRIDPGWFVVRGPNGGYVAALLLQGLVAAVGDASRSPRSLTLHYTAPPSEGPVEIHATVERRGRSLTTATARMLQQDRLLALALGAFSGPRDATAFLEASPPECLPPERCPAMEHRIPMHARYEQRPALGAPPFSGAGSADTGGWIRLVEGDRPLDAPLLAAYADAWPPAIFSRLAAATLGAGAPTIDLTVHFREIPRDPPLRGDDWVLVRFRSRCAREGFAEEDGEIWSRDGRLLAQSRQLALLI